MQSGHMMEIKNVEDARYLWERFFERFFSSEIPDGVDVRFDPTIREFKPRTDQNAKYQRPFSESKRADHSDDFDDFLNNNTISIPASLQLTQDELDRVEEAIRTGDYKNPLLKDDIHVFYAIWLFKQNKISRQQTGTLLARGQIRPEFPITETIAILTPAGQFTKDANETLIPLLRQYSHGGALTDFILERFRLLLQAAPRSEQIFYLSVADPGIVSADDHQLGNILKTNKGWYQVRSQDLHFSFGMIEALQIAKVGCYRACASRIKIGPISLEAIKEGVTYNYRPTAISVKNSGVPATTAKVENYEYTPMAAVMGHDHHHLRLHNTLPPEIHLLLNHLIEYLASYTNRERSKCIWEITDRESYFNQDEESSPDDSIKKTTRLFANVFLILEDGVARLTPFFHQSIPTDEGIAVLIHMLENRELWKKLYKVDIRLLPSPYKNALEKMKRFLKKSGKDREGSHELQNLKFRYFCMLPSTDYARLTRIIDNLSPSFKKRFKFDKLGNRHGDMRNQTILKFINRLPVNCDLLILFQPPNEDERMQARENERPILYKQGNQFWIYGIVGSAWRKTHLSDLRPEEHAQLLDIQFMSDQYHLRSNTVSNFLLSILKKGHTTGCAITEKILKNLIAPLVDQALAQNRPIAHEMIDAAVELVAVQFQSATVNIQRFNQTLEDTLAGFSTFIEKLILLDYCYKKLHPKAALLLTRPQRIQAQRLQERMKQLIAHHKQTAHFNPTELAEFNWQLKMRNSRLLTVNTQQIYRDSTSLRVNLFGQKKSSARNEATAGAGRRLQAPPH